MKKKGLKRLLSLCLSFCMACLPISAFAQESAGDGKVSDIREEEASNDIMCDSYEEVVRVENISGYTPNNMERPYEGEDYSVVNVLGGPSVYAVQENTDPNYAYLAVSGSTVQGILSQTGEARWYGFILDQTSKVSIMVQTVSGVDADLYVFKLDQSTNELNLIGGSVTAGLGVQEYCTGIVDEGIYYFAIRAYEGSGFYAFAYYASQDMDYEANDTVETAAVVDVNGTITGVIDTPFDQDFYKFTLTSPVIMDISKDMGGYQFKFLNVDSAAKIYEISKEKNWYRLEAGTHYFAVYSEDSSFDAGKTYEIRLNKIADVANDSAATLYMVNEPDKIVFQCSSGGDHMYVNGYSININYWIDEDLNSSGVGGFRKHFVELVTVDSLYAIITQTQAARVNEELAQVDKTYLITGSGPMPIGGNAQIQIPGTALYRSGSKGTGEKDMNVLRLSLMSNPDDEFYNIKCLCTDKYKGEYVNQKLNWATVYINPNTGRLVDVYYFNYFYNFLGGSGNILHFIDTTSNCKYLYPYYNGHEPERW